MFICRFIREDSTHYLFCPIIALIKFNFHFYILLIKARTGTKVLCIIYCYFFLLNRVLFSDKYLLFFGDYFFAFPFRILRLQIFINFIRFIILVNIADQEIFCMHFIMFRSILIDSLSSSYYTTAVSKIVWQLKIKSNVIIAPW